MPCSKSRPRISPLLFLPQSPRAYVTSPTQRLPLAYERHEPKLVGDSGLGGAPIIFMHGLFGSKRNNRSMSKVLARDLGRPVYAIDLRNHGESPHSARHDYISMAEDVAGFIGEHRLERPTLIGHSMGAKTAMTLALQSPELVENIISVDNAPVDAALLNDFAKYIQGMRRIEELEVSRQTEADKILQEYEKSLPIRQFLLSNLYRPENGKAQRFKLPLKILAAALDNLGDFPFKNPEEVRFEKPALFVRGTHSNYVPDEAIPIIGQFFPLFKLADIGAGHWVISEQPEAFRQSVVDFLKPQD